MNVPNSHWIESLTQLTGQHCQLWLPLYTHSPCFIVALIDPISNMDHQCAIIECQIRIWQSLVGTQSEIHLGPVLSC